VAPVEVIGNDKHWVTGLKCVRMQLGEPDASGRARPVPIPGSEFVIPCDIVVVAIGTRANPLLTSTCPELKLNKWGNIIVDEKRHDQPAGVLPRRHRTRRGTASGHGRRQMARGD
jgi:glutamate synthase (NADPH/NADH) small chain